MDLKLFHNKALAIKGNIFEVCYISWIPPKKLFFKELYVAAHKLEEHTILNILPAVVSKIANTVETAENVGLWFELINRVIGEIHKE